MTGKDPIENRMKNLLDADKSPVGIFSVLGGATTAEALCMTGVDYIIFDTEHGPYDVEHTAMLLRTAELYGITGVVRVKDSSRGSILKMLDIGASGIIIPQVHSLEEVKQIVEYGKYYPIGRRGMSFGRRTGFGEQPFASGDIQDYFDTCNRQTLLIPQCETVGCLEAIEEIMALDGIDGIFVGPYDLSMDMGIAKQFDHPDFLAALERIKKAARDAGKFSLIYCADAALARQRLKEGFDGVAVGNDVNFFINSVKNMVHTMHQG